MHPAIALDQPSQNPHVTFVRQNIGNATKETNLSFNFTVDKNRISGTVDLPFQVCTIQYKLVLLIPYSELQVMTMISYCLVLCLSRCR